MGFWRSKSKKALVDGASDSADKVAGCTSESAATSGKFEGKVTFADGEESCREQAIAGSSTTCHRSSTGERMDQTATAPGSSEWQRSELKHHDQRQPVSSSSMEADINSEYEPPLFSIGTLGDCFDWPMASDKGSTAVVVPAAHQSLPHSFSASHLEAFADAVNASRGTQDSNGRLRGSQGMAPKAPPRRSSLDASAFMLTSKHSSFPRHKRPPSATPHQVSDEIEETLLQTPQHRRVRKEDTPAIAVRRDPSEGSSEPEVPKKSSKQILKRMIPSRRSARQDAPPKSALAATPVCVPLPAKEQETSIDGDLPSPSKKPAVAPKPCAAEKPEATVQPRLRLSSAGIEKLIGSRYSESTTSVDTGSRLSIASSESSQSSPSNKKVIFGAYQQKPRRESTSLSRKEAKLASIRVLTLGKAFKAAEAGEADSLKTILEDRSPGHDVSVSDRNENASTMLHVAACHGHLKCVEVLLAAAACPHDTTAMVDSDGLTPAMLAIENDHVDCLKRLVEAGNGDLDTDECGNTLLHHASYHGKSSCLQYLLDYSRDQGKDVSDFSNDKGVTPAHVAGQHGHIECLRVLVEGKVDILQNDEDDLSPLDWAKKDNQTLCHHYLTTIESCWSMSEQLEASQEQLDRAVHENASLRVQLVEAKQSRDTAQEEVQKLTQESNEKIAQVRQEFISMIASLFQQLKTTPNASATLAAHAPVARLSASSSESTKWKSVSLPRHAGRDSAFPTSMAHFKSLYEFKDESDDSSDNESDEENLPIFMHSSSSNSSASSARVQNIMAKARARVTRSVSSDVSTDQSGEWAGSAAAGGSNSGGAKTPSPQHRQTAV